MKTILLIFIILIAQATISLSLAQQRIEMNGLSFEVPKEGRYDIVKTGNALVDGAFAFYKKSFVGFFIVQQPLATEEYLNSLTRKIPTTFKNIFADIQISDAFPTTFQGHNALKSVVSSTIDGTKTDGEITTLIFDGYAYIIYAMWEQYKSYLVDDIINSIIFREHTTINQRIEAALDYHRPSIPKEVSPGMILTRIDSNQTDIYYHYNCHYPFPNEERLLVETKKSTKMMLVKYIVDSNSYLVNEWLMAGKAIHYVYNDKDGKHIYTLTFTQNDIDNYAAGFALNK